MFSYDEVHGAARFAVTDRFGGISQPPFGELNLGGAGELGEDAARIGENFRRVGAAFGVEPERVIRVSQVHGRDVHVVRPGDPVPLDPVPRVDALVTTRTDIVLCVRAADCLPVLFVDSANGIIGAAHSGRPGMYAGIAPATVEAMRSLGAEQITAVLGPNACGRCYEVPAEMRAEVAERVPAAYSETSWGTPALDVAAGVKAQLTELGVEVIEDARGCTMEDPALYSYRREGKQSGRLAGLIKLVAA
ncbi:peptidoglycan editing factor PgeF [Kribbella sandramycini]|uniref:Purine nucleoside phosphorylase n=1 Tax=Kribbella sandramycini TaxID=60450 RepID=A0A7Y4KUA1_9ACTN|nr:YfiH family protein [Kribbella sandramycini]NOL38835.1 peptidoglycan editing factor PgeF [Kribbella sandramycini]